ncbi:HAL protein kinase [Allomyces macrogynus ATCC 38327]|uniref:HAL protein kinase n=1 Tax=Allomyces macrogynus (strain ATCC 38327) TaxID=578462 RepID=A0A0L0SBY4_ALLM3|nr:HAL protein kinase [Allomyces macrogynus ATCC 38327]|eukprot:KNE59952.1 HAL protein kinase [Allomyces macrogynus ATCC 38327]
MEENQTTRAHGKVEARRQTPPWERDRATAPGCPRPGPRDAVGDARWSTLLPSSTCTSPAPATQPTTTADPPLPPPPNPPQRRPSRVRELGLKLVQSLSPVLNRTRSSSTGRSGSGGDISGLLAPLAPASGNGTTPRDPHALPLLPPAHSFATKYGVCEKGFIGKGATAVVRVARSQQYPAGVAVKEFRKRRKNETEKEYLKKLIQEYCVASSLLHENVVRTFDLIQDEHERWCEVMEYCPGGDLYTVIRDGNMSRDEIYCCFKQLIRGVAYLHANGVAHRDLKAENLLLDATGRVKLADFGVSEVFRMAWEAEPHRSRGLCGSEPYIAPEAFVEPSYDARGLDIWCPDPRKRANIAYILDHPWFQSIKVCYDDPPSEQLSADPTDTATEVGAATDSSDETVVPSRGRSPTRRAASDGGAAIAAAAASAAAATKHVPTHVHHTAQGVIWPTAGRVTPPLPPTPGTEGVGNNATSYFPSPGARARTPTRTTLDALDAAAAGSDADVPLDSATNSVATSRRTSAANVSVTAMPGHGGRAGGGGRVAGVIGECVAHGSPTPRPAGLRKTDGGSPSRPRSGSRMAGRRAATRSGSASSSKMSQSSMMMTAFAERMARMEAKVRSALAGKNGSSSGSSSAAAAADGAAAPA